MPETKLLTVKLIFNPQKHGINGKISQLAIDTETTVHLLNEEDKTMYSLTFDWNQNDKFIRTEKK